MAKEMLTSKPLIYSIDDDLSMNQLMKARFTQFGCEIKTFSDPELLLNAIREKRPKLLVMDLNLGEGLSGFDIIEAIRFELKLQFPIIIVSGESESSIVAHALEIGATDFVVKPPFRFQFEEKVAEYIQAEKLPNHSQSAMRGVGASFQAAKVAFQISIQGVNPLGFTLISTHLIKKGSSFWLSGDTLKKIVPSTEKVFVTALESTTRLTEEQRSYLIRVEVDSSQEQIIHDIKVFLNSVGVDK